MMNARMRQHWLLTGLVLTTILSGSVFADKRTYPQLPQDAPLQPDLRVLADDGENLRNATLEVQLGLGAQNPRWTLSQTSLQLLPRMLGETAARVPAAGDPLILQAKNPEPTYRGVVLRITRTDGRVVAPMLVSGGRVRIQGGPQIGDDAGRQLEYWLFGTARIRRDLLMASQVLPVLTFEQCRVLGNQIVDTEPRQCLLPDQNILLETNEPLTRAGLKAHDFDSCLQHGQSLIYTFPRRCMAAGGRVFTEPPRVYDTPGDMPLAAGVTNPLGKAQPMSGGQGAVVINDGRNGLQVQGGGADGIVGGGTAVTAPLTVPVSETESQD